MAIYVDTVTTHDSGNWCHMITDGDLTELHAFAVQLGLRRRWFQPHAHHPHYDLRPSKRILAVRLGAIAADRATFVGVMRAWRAQRVA